MSIPMRRLTLALLMTFGLTLPAQAAGSSTDSTSGQNSDYAQAVKLIEAGDYGGAIPLLEKALAAGPKSADAENYLGYSYRKTGETEKALAHYGKALALDPEHRGANEYLGALYLEQGDLAKAEERLAVLDSACFFGCEEHRELKEAIAHYKAKQGS